MLKNVIIILSVFLLWCVTCVALADKGSADTINKLTLAISQARSVSFYYVNRTGNYDYSEKELMAQSTLRVFRDCGGNCKNFMSKVINHFKDSKKTTCLDGQQNLLIQLNGTEPIIYSYTGRMIKFNGKCYFNKTSVETITTESDFIFN